MDENAHQFTLRDLFLLTFVAALLAFAIATVLRPRQGPPLEFVGPNGEPARPVKFPDQ